MASDNRCFDAHDAKACKQVIALALSSKGLCNTVTARGVGFGDLARGHCVFIKIDGDLPSGVEEEMECLARGYGFRLSVPQRFA
jgi:hypothetical protein